MWKTKLLFILTIFLFQVKPEVPQLDVERFYDKMMTEKVILFDVRESKQYKKQRIEHALSVPDVVSLLTVCDTLNKSDVILLYCDYGTRSLQAGEILLENGFTEIYNLKDGFVKWLELNFPVVE